MPAFLYHTSCRIEQTLLAFVDLAFVKSDLRVGLVIVVIGLWDVIRLICTDHLSPALATRQFPFQYLERYTAAINY